MRQLTRIPRPRRGFTLIELMVTLTIASILLVAGLPAYADYQANARLREGANLIVSFSVFARSEAIKRNHAVQVDLSDHRLTVTLYEPVAVAPPPFRSIEVAADVQAPAFAVVFDSFGRPSTARLVNLTSTARACGGDLRCPGVRYEAGGAVSLCRTGCT